MATRISLMRPVLLALVLPVAALTFPAGAQPGRPSAVMAPTLHAGTLEVPLNKSEVVNADRPIAKAMIGERSIGQCSTRRVRRSS